MHENILLFIKINILTSKVSHRTLHHLVIHKDTRIEQCNIEGPMFFTLHSSYPQPSILVQGKLHFIYPMKQYIPKYL